MADVLLLLARVRNLDGETYKAKQELMRSVDFAHKASSAELIVRAAQEAGDFVIGVTFADRDFIALYREALAANQVILAPYRAEILIALAREIAKHDEDLDEALAMLDEARQLAENAEQCSVVYTALWITERLQHSFPQRSAANAVVRQRLEDVLDKIDSAWAKQAAYLTDINDALEAGDRVALEVAEAGLLKIAREQPTARTQTSSFLIPLQRAYREGYLEEASALEASARSFSERAGGRLGSQSQAVRSLDMIRLGRMTTEQFEPYLQVFRQLAEEFPDMSANAVLLMAAYRALGRRDEARVQYEHVVSMGFKNLTFLAREHLLALLASTCADLGDAHGAKEIFSLIHPFTGRNLTVRTISPSLVGATSFFEALLLTTMGRFDEAEAAFEDALQRHESIGARPLLAETRYEYAVMLFKRGRPEDVEKATELINLCVEAAGSMGITPLLEKALRHKGLLKA